MRVRILKKSRARTASSRPFFSLQYVHFFFPKTYVQHADALRKAFSKVLPCSDFYTVIAKKKMQCLLYGKSTRALTFQNFYFLFWCQARSRRRRRSISSSTTTSPRQEPKLREHILCMRGMRTAFTFVSVYIYIEAYRGMYRHVEHIQAYTGMQNVFSYLCTVEIERTYSI